MVSLLLACALLCAPVRAADPPPDPDPAAPFSSSQVELSPGELAAAAAKGWTQKGDSFLNAKGAPVTWGKMSGLLRKETSRSIKDLKAKQREGRLTDADLREARRLYYHRLPYFPKEEKREKFAAFLSAISAARLPKSPNGLGVGGPGDEDGTPPVAPGQGSDEGGEASPPPPEDGFHPSAPPPPGTTEDSGDAPAADGADGDSGGWGCGSQKPAEKKVPASATALGLAILAPALLERLRRRRRRH